MNVLVVFEPAYAGSTCDAVWIVDSPENRAWFERHSLHIDQNSAVFNPASDPLNILWNVFEHHPGWTEINVMGEQITGEIASGIAEEASIQSETDEGFSLKRVS
ncbi:hypothetical protein [Novosphingobium sp.]|jgi:hypothetical protein|uniref:hypothetical protein n=1 Tax=Novosphingobium sp. TaxID=1874826 RepID=UPI002FE033C6